VHIGHQAELPGSFVQQKAQSHRHETGLKKMKKNYLVLASFFGNPTAFNKAFASFAFFTKRILLVAANLWINYSVSFFIYGLFIFSCRHSANLIYLSRQMHGWR